MGVRQPQTLLATGSYGPFNPMASLSTNVMKKILNLEFVEMAELTVDDEIPQTAGRPSPSRLPITQSGLNDFL